jgi:dipeptide/tripeptide permease
VSPRVIAAFFLLPLAIAAERFAWYAASSMRYVRMRELGGDIGDMSASFAMPLVGGVIGGALAALLLPRVVLVAAALCTALGWALASRAVDLDGFKLALDVAGLGSGAMKGALYGLAILVMPTPRMRTLYIVGTYLAINVVGLIAPATGALVTQQVGFASLYGALAVVVVVGAVPAIVVIVVDKLSPRDAAPRRHHGRAVLGALALTGCAMPLYAAIAGLGQRTFDVMRDDGVATSTIGMFHAAPNVVTVLALIGLLAFLASTSGQGASPTQLVGFASLVALLGAALALVPTVATVALAGIIMGVGEVASPLALSRALANHHPRVVTLVVAFWLAFTWAASAIPNPVVSLALAFPLLGVVGGLLIAKGARFDAWLDADPGAAPTRESWMSGR